MNEYHADFLARDRLAEARERAARRELVNGLRRARVRRALAVRLIRLGRRLAGISPRRRARASA